MAKRKIIKIDDDKCNGCGLCVPNCMEGALQIIDDKARLISDLFCDGLGACIGHCPEGAITIEEREAEPYDERKVMEVIAKQGANTIKAHLTHLKEHGAEAFYEEGISYLKEKGIEVPESHKKEESAMNQGGCPGSRMMNLKKEDKEPLENESPQPTGRQTSELQTWPIQLMLVPPTAPYLKNADLVIAADCVAFAHANFHSDIMKNKVTIIGCPKLDDGNYYTEKLTTIFQNNEIKSVTIAHMEVPCCFGLLEIVKAAIAASGKIVPAAAVNISVKGEVLS